MRWIESELAAVSSPYRVEALVVPVGLEIVDVELIYDLSAEMAS